jgi:hypothetical protein
VHVTTIRYGQTLIDPTEHIMNIDHSSADQSSHLQLPILTWYCETLVDPTVLIGCHMGDDQCLKGSAGKLKKKKIKNI